MQSASIKRINLQELIIFVSELHILFLIDDVEI
jgi:hypothetical protein